MLVDVRLGASADAGSIPAASTHSSILFGIGSRWGAGETAPHLLTYAAAPAVTLPGPGFSQKSRVAATTIQRSVASNATKSAYGMNAATPMTSAIQPRKRWTPPVMSDPAAPSIITPNAALNII